MTLTIPREISPLTASIWLAAGTITMMWEGSENTYYEDEFGNEFFVKDYPPGRLSLSAARICARQALDNPSATLAPADWVNAYLPAGWSLRKGAVPPRRPSVQSLCEFIRSAAV